MILQALNAPPWMRYLLVLLLLSSNACSLWGGPKLKVASLEPVSEAQRRAVDESLEAETDRIDSVRALLRVRAQKATFVQDVSAAFVYSKPGLTRLSLFATQFNRLVGLLIADSEGISVLLPDERVFLHGDATAKSMQEALAVALTPDELAAWLRGVLPLSNGSRAVFFTSQENQFITEQPLEEERLLRARIQKFKDGSYRVVAIELLTADEQKPLLYSLVHWRPDFLHPLSLATELSQEALSLVIDISRMELSETPLGEMEAAKVFAAPHLPGVRNLPLSSLDKNKSLLNIR